MQTTYNLSTTEAEYHALGIAAQEVIWLMNFLSEIKSHQIADANSIPNIHYKIFEDNSRVFGISQSSQDATTYKAYKCRDASLLLVRMQQVNAHLPYQIGVSTSRYTYKGSRVQ
eukprot:4159482-Ditylum_brightwellii.AAC.1